MVPTHVVLLGLMGAGKSTTAAALARQLGWRLRDSDVDLQAMTGRTGAAIAAAEGVDALHTLEEEVLLDALATPAPSVVAAAGWVVESARCRTALAGTGPVAPLVVHLDLPVEEVERRHASGSHRRALDGEGLRALHRRRAPLFAHVSGLTLDATRPTAELVAAVLARLSSSAGER